MIIGVLIFAFFLMFIFALISRIRIDDIKENNHFEVDNSNDTIEMENIFFDEVNKGKTKIKFLKIDSQFDLMFIKSLFQSESIPYYIEFENISRIRPGMYIGDLGNYNLLYILDEDYNYAIDIIKDYIENKKSIKGKTENKENIRNITEVMLGNWKVPSANDTNGIEIIYKKNNY
jgi:hypothetical protein